jgi:hypothetical protein
MKNYFITAYATTILLGSISLAFTQSRVTVTGGPGSDDDVVTRVGQAAANATASAATGTVSEERIRQIVREELQRAGLLPPAGMNTGPVGVSPNPASPPQTNIAALSPTGAVGGAISGVSTGRLMTSTGQVGVARPSTAVTPSATGVAGPAGTAGTISGGSSGVGVATPSGAGAIRPPTTAPPSPSGRPATGAPGTGAAGSTGSTTGR